MLALRDLTVAYDTLDVLHGVNLDVAEGEILCLLGPSGCGKSTLLRSIAGLEQPRKGDVVLRGDRINDVPVHQRGVGLMFQDFALFPHMTVAENVAFGLRMQRTPRNQVTRRVQDVLSLVDLAAFGKRDVASLSGGEKQRVALARSLAPEPALLLLDEPLGALDAALKDRLLADLRRIVKSLSLTAIYVTHDQQEAFSVADRITVMNAGRIEQVAPPATLYHSPDTTFVATFLGLHNVIAATNQLVSQGSKLTGKVLIHPDGISLVDGDGDLSGTVEEVVFQGRTKRVLLRLPDDVTLRFVVAGDRDIAPGDAVAIAIDPARLIPLRDTSR